MPGAVLGGLGLADGEPGLGVGLDGPWLSAGQLLEQVRLDGVIPGLGETPGQSADGEVEPDEVGCGAALVRQPKEGAQGLCDESELMDRGRRVVEPRGFRGELGELPADPRDDGTGLGAGGDLEVPEWAGKRHGRSTGGRGG